MTHRLEAMGQAKYAGLTVLNNKGDRHFNGQVRTDPKALTIPLGWRKPRRIFVNSMSDLFHKNVPFEFIDQVFAVMALTPQHTYQVLTKRPERAAEYFADSTRAAEVWRRAEYQCFSDGLRVPDVQLWPLPHVWLGTSCGHQEAADAMIPHLLACPAAVRFLSCEPLTGPIDLRLRHEALTDLMDSDPARSERHRGTYPLKSAPPEARTHRAHLIDWVIVGGESGPGARPCNVQWIREIVRQCREASVPCFVKQLGSKPIGTDTERWEMDGRTWEVMQPNGSFVPWKFRDPKGGDPAEWPEDLRVREFPRHLDT